MDFKVDLSDLNGPAFEELVAIAVQCEGYTDPAEAQRAIGELVMRHIDQIINQNPLAALSGAGIPGIINASIHSLIEAYLGGQAN